MNSPADPYEIPDPAQVGRSIFDGEPPCCYCGEPLLPGQVVGRNGGDSYHAACIVRHFSARGAIRINPPRDHDWDENHPGDCSEKNAEKTK